MAEEEEEDDYTEAVVVGGADEHKSDEAVRAYVRKRKRANKNCSVSHLRRALNIGYKKAKRIHDEVDEELRRREGVHTAAPVSSHQARRPSSRRQRREEEEAFVDGGRHYQPGEDQGGAAGQPLPKEDREEAMRELIRAKLRRGEVVYLHLLRDFGLSYHRTRGILQEFIDQGKMLRLPRSALVSGELNRGTAQAQRTEQEAVKMKPLKQKVKEENKKAAENQAPKPDAIAPSLSVATTTTQPQLTNSQLAPATDSGPRPSSPTSLSLSSSTSATRTAGDTTLLQPLATATHDDPMVTTGDHPLQAADSSPFVSTHPLDASIPTGGEDVTSVHEIHNSPS